MLCVVYGISDRAVVSLFRFLKYLFKLIGKDYNVADFNEESLFPVTIKGCYSVLDLNYSPYKEYIVCPSCHLLYDCNTQALVSGTTNMCESLKCQFVEFPNHPQLCFRNPCNTALLNKIIKGQRVEFKPRKVYYYFGIISALLLLLMRSGFLIDCNSWIANQRNDNFLADITDGQVWNELVSSFTDSGTLSSTNLIGLLINIDWFQPFKHISYSVGVIYAVIINLPRSMHYKDENVVIIGIIPGPHEPKTHINSYLGPFVSELQQLQYGQWFETPFGRQFIRCILMCLSSDIPATRKAAGFVGHNAKKACSRCLKNFERVDNHLTCGGFDRSTWPQRTHAVHCKEAYKAFTAPTKIARKNIEKEFGSRYSVLYELPYYDAIRFPVIDAMHNLFLGTAKHYDEWRKLKYPLIFVEFHIR